ncbi:hypothetical protein RUM43_003954 [Polyplax serrata]|uniref:Uncharacterized protein n=1 Tax=Polyplax serrata TaxID=468196 RepID=A0AAN8S917_POLSC
MMVSGKPLNFLKDSTRQIEGEKWSVEEAEEEGEEGTQGPEREAQKKQELRQEKIKHDQETWQYKQTNSNEFPSRILPVYSTVQLGAVTEVLHQTTT